MELDGHAFTMVGVPVQMKHASQRIDVAGSAGDVYSLGGWAKGDIAPMTDDGRSFCVLVQFMNSDGSNDILEADGGVQWEERQKVCLYIRLLRQHNLKEGIQMVR